MNASVPSAALSVVPGRGRRQGPGRAAGNFDVRRSRTVGRVVALASVVVAVTALAVLLLGGGTNYVVRARFQNASQLVKGNEVQVAGVHVGTVRSIDLTDDGQAEIEMK